MNPATTQQLSTPRHARARAFTLVELMVVIGIIVLLVGLGAGAFAMFRTQAQVRQTMGLLQNVHSIANEYQAVTGQVYDPGADDGCIVSDPHDTPSAHTECFVQAAWNLPESEEFIRQLGDYLRVCPDGIGRCDPNNPDAWRGREYLANKERFEHPGDNGVSFTIIDRWQKPLRYFPSNAGENRVMTMPAHPRPFFASAGPRGRWGDHRQLLRRENGETLTDEQARLADRAADNLYSFDLD